MQARLCFAGRGERPRHRLQPSRNGPHPVVSQMCPNRARAAHARGAGNQLYGPHRGLMYTSWSISSRIADPAGLGEWTLA